ncbi:tRNA (guanosine(46)-N7)-methyltransferase TrmB [Taibaiella soli]|uniref:tRNA (guanine-N(7)-)-methyltransferase n=1 Tax=Taibaiella soli TaxID=1649169 RepID=A0A2W2AE04_9BACT|nr:tRNA (guanosine(46)-N7)-methyltransferase TrmB [Taibaiella soli]PZF73511.1 tRNA (guanosine(46)-N7)-methyltransferase TrmB [Taibaiella soli]
MGQKKLIRFAEIKTFPNVLQYPENMQGQWHEFFKNEHPITLELACGKGEYAVGLGRMYPERNFIGIDVKGNRIWKGAKTALQEGMNNIAFVRSQIDKVTDYFKKDEVKEIWITFPDPQLRISRIKKRLTHPRFLRLYQQFLVNDGIVHLKTDSPDLYNFTKTVIELYDLELLQDDDNVFAKTEVHPELKIKTHYEGLDIAQSNRIHYLEFRLNKDLPLEKDETLKQIIHEQTPPGAR